MPGFRSDHINLIAANLRDRYKSGFPILKELIQNADDASAVSLVFGYHAGFSGLSQHPLLQGPALWVLNDGEALIIVPATPATPPAASGRAAGAVGVVGVPAVEAAACAGAPARTARRGHGQRSARRRSCRRRDGCGSCARR
jgi:hypothetical protein